MEENKISLQDVVDLSKNYYSGKVDNDELNDFGNKIIIKSNISILEKTSLVMLLLTQAEYTDTDDIAFKMAELYMHKFFYCLIGAYTNIEVNEDLISLENYDLVSSLFKKFILQYCKEDYEELEDILRDSIQVGNLEQIINIFGNLDSESLNKASKDLDKAFNKLKKEEKMIENLKDIASFNDPILNQAIEKMKEMALTDTKK